MEITLNEYHGIPDARVADLLRSAQTSVTIAVSPAETCLEFSSDEIYVQRISTWVNTEIPLPDRSRHHMHMVSTLPKQQRQN